MKARVLGAAIATTAALFLASAPGQAQTWTGGRTTPALTEIVAIDATGETDWLYGQEDLAGDGLDNFKQQEQSIDVRTAYASTDSTYFWVRVYVSDPNAVGGNIAIYVFIDSDMNVTSGGTAAATEIDPKLTDDPSTGGYEHVIGIRGNGSIANIWTWQSGMNVWEPAMPAPTTTEVYAETGQDGDPIQINGVDHGYLQGVVELGLVGLTQACSANLFVRSVNQSSVGAGDLEVGKVAPCIPADANGDSIPDLVIPVQECSTDDQCPADGICVDGACIVGIPCLTDLDCATEQQCSSTGTCIPDPGPSCNTNADCGDLVCFDGICNSCTLDGASCDTGQRCAPNGHCIIDSGGPGLSAGEMVQGGAFACGVAPSDPISRPSSSDGHGAPALLLWALGLLVARKRGRAGKASTPS